MHAYEKGIIWGNDNYLIQSALVDLVLATHNVGRRGTGVVRMGGHQEGYTRPPYPGDSKIYIDQEVIQGKGMMYTCWGANPFQTTLNAEQHRRVIMHRTAIVKEAMANRRGATTQQTVDVIYDAVQEQGRPVLANINLYPTMLSDGAHVLLPAAHPGETNLTSMNGERRLRLSQTVHGSAGLREGRLPDRGGHRQYDQGAVPGRGQGGHGRALQRIRLEDRGRRVQRRLPQGRHGGRAADRQPGRRDRVYRDLRASGEAGNNGVQLPIKEYKDGKLIGTEMLYMDAKFDTADGKAIFKPSPWPGLPKTRRRSEGQAPLLDQ